MTDTQKPALPRERRTQDQVKQEHFNEVLTEMPFEEKVALIKELKEEINIEVTNRRTLADQAASITNGL